MNKDKKNKKSNGGMYEVEKIIGKKKEGSEWLYKVKWLGYSERESTWEKIENLENVKDLVEMYDNEKNGKGDLTNSNEKLIGKKRKKVLDEEEEEEKEKEDLIYTHEEEKIKVNKSKGVKKRPDLDQSLTLPAVRTRRNSKLADQEEHKDKEINNISEFKKPIFSPPTSPKSYKEKELKEIKEIKTPLSPSSRSRKSVLSEKETTSEFGVLGIDKPSRIVHGKQHEDKYDLISCEVDWMPRKDGTKPKNSFYTNKELKEANPHLLCDFYEERLKFPSKKKN